MAYYFFTSSYFKLFAKSAAFSSLCNYNLMLVVNVNLIKSFMFIFQYLSLSQRNSYNITVTNPNTTAIHTTVNIIFSKICKPWQIDTLLFIAFWLPIPIHPLVTNICNTYIIIYAFSCVYARFYIAWVHFRCVCIRFCVCINVRFNCFFACFYMRVWFDMRFYVFMYFYIYPHLNQIIIKILN